MPLTPAEKMKKYQERFKSNPELYEQMKVKDRSRKSKKREQMSLTQLEQHQHANRNAVRQHRARKKAEYVKQPSTPIKVFKTSQALGKAKQRVARHLPQSPRHKKELILSLARQFGIESSSQYAQAKSNNALPAGTVDKIKKHYLESSWTCPGKKDVVIVRENGKKQKRQKHYLLTTLKEAHSVFSHENPDYKVGFAKFCDLRPPEVKLMHSVPHSSCLCAHHENVRFLLMALNKHCNSFPTDFHEFIERIVCNQVNEECMFGLCSSCPTVSILKPDTGNNTANVSWWQWAANENGKVEKVEFSGSLEECFDLLTKLSLPFLKHTFIKRMQSRAFTEERESVASDETKVVIQVDFAENYTSQIQNAIQSSYWLSKQFTLFTVCAWEKDGCHSIVIASDYLSHDKYAVLTFMNMLVDYLESIRGFSRFVIFSDGAASQFKQRFTLSGITLLGKSLSWNFFATSHGKGAVDGIGGRLKRDVQSMNLAKGVVIKNLDDFVDAAEECSHSITILKCNKGHVEAQIAEIDRDTITCAAIPGTHKIHCVEVVSPYVVQTKEHYYSQRKPSQHVFKTTSTDICDNLPDNDCSSSKLFSTSHYEQMETIDHITPGSWLLVKYENEFFLGIVLEVSQLVPSVHVRCLEKPYGVTVPQDLEKERMSVWYDITKVYKAPVIPHMVQIKRAWKYTY